MGEDLLADVGLAAGQLIAGKYRVERAIASGGMGVVLTAQYEALQKRVAIKVLLPELAEHAEAAQRFFREAQAAAGLSSGYVVSIHDVDTLANGTPFMVMEYLEGQDLGDELEERGKLPVAEAVQCLIEGLRGVVEAHAAGIVHRDLKPQNMFLVKREDGSRSHVIVLDFGISKVNDDAKIAGQQTGQLTRTHALLGTPSYMSPEQIVNSKDVDGRTDVWSSGAILYELLTGEVLFDAETAGVTIARILQGPIPPLRSKLPGAPEALELVLARALERDRNDRYGSAGEFLLALESLAGVNAGERAPAPPTGPALPRSAASPTTTMRSIPPARGEPAAPVQPPAPGVAPAPGETSTTAMVGTAVGALLFGALGYWLLQRLLSGGF